MAFNRQISFRAIRIAELILYFSQRGDYNANQMIWKSFHLSESAKGEYPVNFYFTGTGNSLYAAKQLDNDYRSIPQVLRQGKLTFSAECIGVVCPIYGHEMPRMVKGFLKEAVFHTEYLYLVLTYGKRHGGAAELAGKYLESVGKRADYINTVLMVDNFLPAFDMTQELALNKKVDEQLALIRSDIEGKKYSVQTASFQDRMAHKGYLATVKNSLETIWADYRITDDCVGCGICARVCPAGCIRIDRQRAVNTGENCQACYACIHACPKTAIQFGDIPMNEPNPEARYRNPKISLSEIVQSNDQTDCGQSAEESMPPSTYTAGTERQSGA